MWDLFSGELHYRMVRNKLFHFQYLMIYIHVSFVTTQKSRYFSHFSDKETESNEVNFSKLRMSLGIILYFFIQFYMTQNLTL